MISEVTITTKKTPKAEKSEIEVKSEVTKVEEELIFFFGGGEGRVHHKHLLHDKINPKDCQVLSLGDFSGFSNF